MSELTACHTPKGDLVHITRDGATTLCGKPVAERADLDAARANWNLPPITGEPKNVCTCMRCPKSVRRW